MNKKIVAVVVLALLVAVGCGSSKATARIDELQAKNDALEKRVRSLEDQLLETQKKMIAHEQALQVVNGRMREIEDYFNRMQVSQGQPPR